MTSLVNIPVWKIDPGEHQPRRKMDPDALQQLADSIAHAAVIQPIIVTPVADGRYELVAGERRWRASKMAGKDEIPAIVRQVSVTERLEIALTENISREAMNPVDTAMGLLRLADRGLTHTEIAAIVGFDEKTVSHHLRILKLVEPVLGMMADGLLSLSHGKCLVTLAPEDQIALAEKIIKEGLSSTAAEKLASNLRQDKKQVVEPDSDISRLENRISESLGAKTQISASNRNPGKGRITIHYSSFDELDGLLGRMGIEQESDY